MGIFRTLDDSARPVRVIQVGAGGMGQAWIQAVSTNPDVELVGIVDLNPDASKAGVVLAGDPAIATSTDLAQLLVDTSPDAILDITIPAAHHPVTMHALSAGLPVLGEKPAAETVAQALSLAAASQVAGELFMVSQSRRYNHQLAAFKKRSEQLGDLGTVSTQFAKAPHFGGFREEMDDVLLLDMAIHPFDSVRYLLDRDPVAVYCESYNPSWSWYRGDAAASAIFEFEGGIRYTYDGSWCAPGLETSWNGSWRINGAHGTATWDGDNEPDLEVPDVDATTTPGGGSTAAEDINGSLASFVSALRTGVTPDGEVHGNIMSLAMVEAAIQSTRTRTRVDIDDVLRVSLETATAEEERVDVLRVLEGWADVRSELQNATRAATTP